MLTLKDFAFGLIKPLGNVMTLTQSYVKVGNVAKLVVAEAAVIPGCSGKGRTATSPVLAEVFPQISDSLFICLQLSVEVICKS